MPRPIPDLALSATIRQLRECKGVTREVLAYRAGLSTGALARIELAQTAPNWTNYRGIADALGLSITALAAFVEATEKNS
jgi:transcriptional regulator with XRE-family HTH domain